MVLRQKKENTQGNDKKEHELKQKKEVTIEQLRKGKDKQELDVPHIG